MRVFVSPEIARDGASPVVHDQIATLQRMQHGYGAPAGRGPRVSCIEKGAEQRAFEIFFGPEATEFARIAVEYPTDGISH